MAVYAWVLLAFLLSFVSRGVGFQCPHPCFCYPNFDAAQTITVDCRGQDLFEIPFPIPPETSSLDVSNNLIEYVRTIDLPDELPRLRFLQLQNNALIDIEPGALSTLPNLEVLRLTNNNVRHLRNGTFNGLNNLQTLEAYNLGLISYQEGLFSPLTNLVTLDLSFNNLQTILSGTFSGFPRLQRLYLSDNFLTTVQPQAIADLPSLSLLNLAYNQLRDLDADALSNLPRLASVSLRENPIECGCGALWLYNFLTANNLIGPVCAQPEEFRGRALLQLTTSEFCALPTANITTPPVAIATGATLQIDCTATGAPPPTFSWSRNGMTFDPNDERIMISSGSLIISSVGVDDSGDYYCTVTNSAGQVSASVPVAVVNVSDVSVVEVVRGDTVTVDCVDMRAVDAPLRWLFNSSVLELSDKHAVLGNGSLLIRGVDLEDMGDYVCEVGALTFTRTLNVSAAPEIVQFTEGECATPLFLSIDSDETVVLVCSVFGIPPPQVEWFYQGVRQTLVTPTAGMVGGAVTAELELFRPSPEQSGNYTCVGTSSLGSVRRTLSVSVRLITDENANPTLNVVYFVGDTAVLECDLGERIEPGSMVMWRTGSGVDLPEDRVVIVDRNTTLIIKDLMFPSDRDTFECIITLPNGGRSRLRYDLILNQPPVIAKEMGIPIVTAVAGTNVSLECRTEATPGASYQWLVNDTALEDSAIVGRSLVEVIGQQLNRNFGVRLNISFVREGDNGLYNCTAVNVIPGVEGTFQDSYLVELQILRLPYFTYQPEPTAVTSGDTATLLCGGRGTPSPILTWFVKRGNTSVPVTPDLRHVITSHALLIQRVEPADQGHYFCEISSPLQTRTSPTAHLRVYTSPQLAPLVSEVRVPVDSVNATLDCFGTGDPVPVVHWLRGDTVLPTAGEQVLLENGSLVIFDVEPADGGMYMCRLANVAGMVYHTVTLTVLTLPDTRVEPQAVTAHVGCQVTFQCTDGGRVLEDPAEILWSRGGQRLEEGGGVSVLSTGELVLSDLTIEDSGNYTCTLWSELGFRADVSLLTVEDPIFASGAPVAPPTLTTSTPLIQSLPLLSTAQFVCFVSGFPPPELVWLRDGIPQPRLRRVDFVNRGLTIRNLRITDNATYTCEATNVLGSDSIDFQLSVSVPPSFDTRPVTQTLLFGEVLTLNCTASGHPPPQIMWLHNNTMVVSEEDPPRRVYFDPVSGGLSVNRVTGRDAGLYTCVARSVAGVAETSVPVFVQDDMIAPNITEPPESVSTETGMSVALDCEAFGLPAPTVTWFMDGLTLDPCPPGQLSFSGELCVSNGSVFIQSAEEEDTGRYTCRAENSAGVAVYEVFVSVENATSIPVFNVTPVPMWLVNGSYLRLDCEAIGSPPPTITWLFNSDPITLIAVDCSSGSLTSDLVVCSNGSVIVTSVDISHEGLYTCVADNEVGVNQVSVLVDVGEASDDDVEGLLSPPTLVSTPTVALPLLPGDNVTLNCSAEGNPPPTISWVLDGAPVNLSLSSNLFQLPDGSLLLTMASASDGGQYTCLAQNSLGTAQISFLLDFEELGRLATGNVAPVITIETKSRMVMEGSKVEVQCVAKGHPDPTVVWKHNGSVVYESAVRKVVGGRLLIFSAQVDHSGNYTCLALNKEGSTQSQLFLTIEPRPVPPRFQLTPNDTKVVVGESFVLECTSAAPLTWYRGNDSVEGLLGHRTLCDGGALVVSDVRRVGKVEYRCAATSSYGVSTSYATVTVTSAVVTSEWHAVLGSSVSLTCDSSGGWSRQGAAVQLSSRVVVKNGLLVLLQVELSDEGEYFCSGQLHYLHISVPPQITTSGDVVRTAQAGTSVHLNCMASGRPRPSVSWRRARGNMSPTSTAVFSDGSLWLLNVTRSDRDLYTCIARNSAGEDERSIYFHVSD